MLIHRFRGLIHLCIKINVVFCCFFAEKKTFKKTNFPRRILKKVHFVAVLSICCCFFLKRVDSMSNYVPLRKICFPPTMIHSKKLWFSLVFSTFFQQKKVLKKYSQYACYSDNKIVVCFSKLHDVLTIFAKLLL